MARQSTAARSTSAPAGSTTKKYEYIVLRVDGEQATRLGIVKARNADDAMGQFATHDPQSLAAVSKARWTQRDGVQLRNKPELDLGTPVQITDGQMELNAA